MSTRWACVAGLFGGLLIAVAVGGRAGPPCGLVAALALGRALRRMESPARRRERARAAADLPVAADLLAAALRAGAPPDRAALVVGEALGGPVGQRLATVGRSLRVGIAPVEAWSELVDIPAAHRLVRAAVHGANSGAALSRALERLADDLRAQRAAEADTAVRRAGVLAVLPLGLCFLPAFLLTGVVPVVMAVLGDALSGG